MADTVALMKQRILDMAIRGELVEQRPEEGTAKELLERIEEEKQRLIEEKKIKKEKKLPEITEEELPFDIPENWEWVRLGTVTQFQNGYAFKSSLYSEKGVKLVRIGDIVNGHLNIDTMVKIPNEIAKGVNEELYVYPSDFVIAMSGATTGKLGFNTTDEKLLLNQRVGKISPILVNKNYIFNLLTTLIVENLNKAMGSAIPNLSTKQIMEIKVPLPPLYEQKRIVAKIETLLTIVDKIADRKEEMLQIIQHIRQTAFQEAVQGNLVEQDENDEAASLLLEKINNEKEQLIKGKKIKKENKLPEITEKEIPFDIPDSWEWVRLGDVSLLTMGQSPKGATVSIDNNGIEFHQGKVYFGKKFLKESDQKTESPKKVVEADTVLLSVRAPVGNLNITPRKISIGRGLCGIDGFSGMSSLYYFYFLSAFDKEMKEKSTGTTFKAISGNVIKNLAIPLPPIKEQERIIDKLNRIMNICDVMKDVLDGSREELEIVDVL